VDQQPLGDDVAHRHARVQRRVRVLEDDLHVAAQRLQLVAAQVEDILAVEKDRAFSGWDQAQDGARDGGFAAAGFPHQAEGFALAHGEADIIHRLDPRDHALEDARAHREIGLEVLHDQEVFLGHWDRNSHENVLE
jgi:hypothetical protein